MLHHPRANDVLVIGHASGITLGAVTRYNTPTRIDAVELEPAVVRASHFFDEINHRPLDDPRVQLRINDGRNFLHLTDDGSYDVIISEPPNPWLTGVANLFTHEFFELGRRKLRAGGVWAQWVQSYGMMPDDLRSLLGTFADVYEHVAMFRSDLADFIILGSDRPIDLAASSIDSVLIGQSLAREDLARIDRTSAESILGLYLMGRHGVVAVADGSPFNTDDNMRVEYAAPLSLHLDTVVANAAMLERNAEITPQAVRGQRGLRALAREYASVDLTARRSRAVLRLVADAAGPATGPQAVPAGR
jgi:spermidine synthase